VERENSFKGKKRKTKRFYLEPWVSAAAKKWDNFRQREIILFFSLLTP